MSTDPAQQQGPPTAASGGAAGAPSEEELRAAYEAELLRITPAEVMLQSAVSLLNIAARRLGLTGAGDGSEPGAGAGGVGGEGGLEDASGCCGEGSARGGAISGNGVVARGCDGEEGSGEVAGVGDLYG